MESACDARGRHGARVSALRKVCCRRVRPIRASDSRDPAEILQSRARLRTGCVAAAPHHDAAPRQPQVADPQQARRCAARREPVCPRSGTLRRACRLLAAVHRFAAATA